MTHDLKHRICRLEAKTSDSKGVAGIVHGRGQAFDPAAQAFVGQQVAELHAAGHSVVYVAHLAGRLPPATGDTANFQPPRN